MNHIEYGPVAELTDLKAALGVKWIRGIETSVGQGGHCLACGITMPDGPDACLGYIPNVAHACCGHGGACEPYVVIGGEPDEGWDHRRMTSIHGVGAYEWLVEAIR